MSRMMRSPIERQLDEAEGFLMLDLPRPALRILEARTDWSSMQFEACVLKGEALRALGRYREALSPLEKAANLRPTNPQLALALGWCYKRTNRLAQAIDAIDCARRSHPGDPLLRYNLACYWSLAGNLARAFDELAAAVELEPDLRHLIAEESDFDRLRAHPEFGKLLVAIPRR
jgi:tetratricopeptide (TPR) repeat protein